MVSGLHGNANDARYDTLIAGGEVVDPAAGLSGRLDVAIAGGRVVAVAPDLDRSNAAAVIDAAGQYVTPGLVDTHTHIYWGVTYWGIEPDPVAARSGVTTWVDAGSSGGYSFPGFRRYVAQANRARVLAFLNLSVIGLVAPTYEFANLDYCDVALGEAIVAENRDLIIGIKARIDSNTTRGTGIAPLERARELADRVGLPLMVHIGSGPPALEEILSLMKPGDILTHCFRGAGDHRILGADGKVRPDVIAAQARGVILDIGHGTGSFGYDTAEAALAQGIVPDVISSDIHQLAVQGPMFDLPTTLSKFLNLGMSVPAVIERATSRAAAAIRRPDLGTLAVGSRADIALFRMEEGEFTFYDTSMHARTGKRRLVNTLTLVEGARLPEQAERAHMVWANLPEHQAQVLMPRQSAAR